jgi:DNA-directed RNA polymerase specialized sigma subunit
VSAATADGWEAMHVTTWAGGSASEAMDGTIAEDLRRDGVMLRMWQHYSSFRRPLSDREHLIVGWRHEGKTLADIGQRLSLSRGRVQQIAARAEVRLWYQAWASKKGLL